MKEKKQHQIKLHDCPSMARVLGSHRTFPGARGSWTFGCATLGHGVFDRCICPPDHETVCPGLAPSWGQGSIMPWLIAGSQIKPNSLFPKGGWGFGGFSLSPPHHTHSTPSTSVTMGTLYRLLHCVVFPFFLFFFEHEVVIGDGLVSSWLELWFGPPKCQLSINVWTRECVRGGG